MGCGCAGSKGVNGATRAVTLHAVDFADGTRRNYLTEEEARAAVRASQRTTNQATYTPPVDA